MEIQNNTSYDGTMYHFIALVNNPVGHTTWYVATYKGGILFKWFYDGGKFDIGDYGVSSNLNVDGVMCGCAFWDYFKMTDLERKEFRTYWIKNMSPCKTLSVDDFYKAKAMLQANTPCTGFTVVTPYISSKKTHLKLGPCTTSQPKVDAPTPAYEQQYYQNQQGNNPMRNETASVSSATVINAVSDESKQRDFLLSELNEKVQYSWRDEVYSKLKKMFNIGAPIVPKTSQELIDAFKNGKVTIDQKKVDRNAKYWASRTKDEYFDDDDSDFCEGDVYERFFGVTFNDLPVEDRKGYDAAVEAYDKAKTATKRKIMIGTPAEGLDALIALENWQPTGLAS